MLIICSACITTVIIILYIAFADKASRVSLSHAIPLVQTAMMPAALFPLISGW